MKKALPIVQNFGIVPVDIAVAHHLESSHQIKAFDNTCMYIDYETPHPTHKVWMGDNTKAKQQIHLGVSGDFIVEKTRLSSVKPHIDIYIPLRALDELIASLIKLKEGVEK